MSDFHFDSFEDKTIFVKGSNQEISPWDRTKIIAILMDESGIPFDVAEKIADDVQKIVFSSNLKTVSSSLLRELVNSKLVEYGYSRILNKTRRLGLSVSDVKEAVKNIIPYKSYMAVSPQLSSLYISETVKSQLSSFIVFPEKLINMHYEGKLHINGINGIDRVYAVFLDVSKLLNFSYAGDNFFIKKAVNGFDFFENLVKITSFLSRFTNYSIILTGIEKAIKYFEIDENREKVLANFILGLETALIDEKPVKIFLKEKETVEVAANVYKENFCLKSEVLTSKNSYIPSKNISIFGNMLEGTTFIMENITLNLPGIALSAKLKNSDFFKELFFFVDKAFSIFSKKGIFLEKMLMTKGQSIFEFLKKLGFNPLTSFYALSVCGLQEAVSLLREKGKFDNNDIDFAADILSYVKTVLKDLEDKYKLKVLLSDSDQTEIAYRFARLDLKFEPYYVGKIVKGDISSGGVYYSSNGSFTTNYFLNVREAMAVEEKLKRYFDFPFKTVIKLIDFENVKVLLNHKDYSYLMLTQDFSVCYHCYVMKSGIYKSCPECLSEDVTNYFYLYSNYAPYSKLNRALRVMMKNNVYYEEFTI